MRECPKCVGRGKVDCLECNGIGSVPVIYDSDVELPFPAMDGCKACNATGRTRCDVCKGAGTV